MAGREELQDTEEPGGAPEPAGNDPDELESKGQVESTPVEGRPCTLLESLEDSHGPLALAIAAGSFIAGIAMASTGGPLGAGVAVVAGAAAYAVLSLLGARLRVAGLALALGAHITAIVNYYSSPIPLPLVIIERGPEGATMNLDIVQLLAVYEAQGIVLVKERCTRQKPLKPPEPLEGQTEPAGPQPQARSRGAGLEPR